MKALLARLTTTLGTRGNWQWTIVALVVTLAALCAGFSDGGGGDTWWEGP